MNNQFYILQLGLHRYFKSLKSKDDEVEITDSPLMALLFTDKLIAKRFQVLLRKHYKKEFVIITL